MIGGRPRGGFPAGCSSAVRRLGRGASVPTTFWGLSLRTRGDLSLAVRQRDLEKTLQRFEDRLT